MQRKDLLENQWFRYPAAQSGVLDCAAAVVRLETSVQKIGGRLAGGPGQFSLNSGGATLPIEFAPEVKWLGLRSQVVFEEAQLSSGDLVCITGKLQLRNKQIVLLGTEVQLLFAAKDPCWQNQVSSPSTFQFSVKQAKAWASFVEAVRDFFQAREFIEARTPTLVPSPGTEPFLDAFATEMQFGPRRGTVYLPTSPEFHLKKLLVAGFTRIFEFKECFRNKEAGHHHQPEFLMLEWYRAYATLDDIARDAAILISDVSEVLTGQALRLKRMTIAQLFKEHLGFQLTPKTTLSELQALAKAQNIPYANDDTWDEVYFRIFLEKLETKLGEGGPYLIQNYPPSQAALARINDDGWADRFEIYFKGLEIANAFHELNDPAANEERFQKDKEEAERMGKTPVPHDQELVGALYTGMPPSGGIALGMDRLFMALLGIEAIEETRAFPVKT